MMMKKMKVICRGALNNKLKAECFKECFCWKPHIAGEGCFGNFKCQPYYEYPNDIGNCICIKLPLDFLMQEIIKEEEE